MRSPIANDAGKLGVWPDRGHRIDWEMHVFTEKMFRLFIISAFGLRKLVSFRIANMFWCKLIRMKMFWISTTKLNSNPSSMKYTRKKDFWSFCKLLNFSRTRQNARTHYSQTWSSLTVYPSLGTKRKIRTFRQSASSGNRDATSFWVLTYEPKCRPVNRQKLLIESKVTILFIYIACISLTCGISVRAKSHTKVAFDFCLVIVFFKFIFRLAAHTTFSLFPIRFPCFRYSLEADEFLGWFNRKLNVVPFHYNTAEIGLEREKDHAACESFFFFSTHELAGDRRWLRAHMDPTISNGYHIHGRRTHRLTQSMDTRHVVCNIV